ncbi:ABC transporter substrate-binding protein [Paenibacillus sacheonensis]|uniref:DUF3502 domain-containing protein n=1 Tax=Paenibacillus sacheonensis TaxID=742054 RepID=A0A7X5BZZ6_9BACL|nr:ABC transporter substrate-binding protein [Paenibacillus sacheonensis]MBM7565971.1 putative aldouronate transport system substrate-binding protein [Paenibacillus sacheonensis]NBC68715.1 DUF3502 domain-containing protein [Paenibacillus sacheonensis]
MVIKGKGLWKLGLASMLMIPAVTACGSNNDNNNNQAANTNSNAPATNNAPANNAAGTEELKPVELTYYIPQGELQTDYKSVEKAINDYIQPKINATLKFNPVVFGDYEQKLNTVVAAQESFDLAWTSSWLFNYENNAQKGAFLQIDDLMKQYAGDFIGSLPAAVIEGAKASDGKTYAIPNYQVSASNGGFVIQKELVDKYSLDTGTIKTFKDLEPFLEQIKQNEPDKIPYASRVNTFVAEMNGFEGVNGFYYRKGDPEFKLVDTMTTPEYLAHFNLLHDWYKKGYINNDVATANFDDTLKSGKGAVKYEFTLKPGGEVEELARNGGHEVVYIPTYEAQFTGVQSTMTAISKTSKNPERAMMFLNLVNTDPTLFNLLAFGVEGKNYEVVGDNTIKIKPDGGYAPNSAWAMGNVTIGHLLEGQAPDTWQKTIDQNNNAKVPTIFGFAFDPTPVKTEVANLEAVYKEYEAALTTGTVDPNVYVPKLIAANKKAGSEKVLAEKQKQLDAWLAAKGLK